MDYPVLRTLCDKIEASLNEVIDAAERNKAYLDDDLKISHNFVSAIMGLKCKDASVSVKRHKTVNSEEISKSMDLSSSVFHNISKIEEKMRPQTMTEQRIIVGRLIQLTDTREQLKDGPIVMKPELPLF